MWSMLTPLFALLAATVAAFPVNQPAAISPQARPIALATAETQNELVAVSLADGRVIRRVDLPADPENIETGPGGPALVVSTKAGTVTLVDPRSFRIMGKLGGFDAPHIAAIAPDGEWGYVSDDATGKLAVIELSARRVVRRLQVGLGAHHMSISPDERRLWIALGEHARTIVVVDLKNPSRPRVLRRFEPGFGVHDLAFGSDGRTVWVTASTGSSVHVLSAHTGRALFTVPAGIAPQHVAFAGRFAYVTSGYGGSIEQVEARTGRVLRTASVPYGSFNLSIAGGRVVISSLLRGTVTELNSRLRVLRSERIAPASRDVALVFR